MIPTDIDVFKTEGEKSFYRFFQAVAKGQGLFSLGLERIIDGLVQFGNCPTFREQIQLHGETSRHLALPLIHVKT